MSARSLAHNTRVGDDDFQTLRRRYQTAFEVYQTLAKKGDDVAVFAALHRLNQARRELMAALDAESGVEVPLWESSTNRL